MKLGSAALLGRAGCLLSEGLLFPIPEIPPKLIEVLLAQPRDALPGAPRIVVGLAAEVLLEEFVEQQGVVAVTAPVAEERTLHGIVLSFIARYGQTSIAE
jgi:hypothetical protein